MKKKYNPLNDIVKPLDNTFNRDDDPLLLGNNSCIYIISGRRGAGKSTLALSLLNSKKAYRKRFDNLFLISPTAKSDKKFAKVVEELEEDERFYEELNEKNIEQIVGYIKGRNEETQKKELHCLVLDDCVLDLPKSKSSLINRIVITSRHLNLTLIIISQKYNALPTIIRSNADLISFFPSLNSHEIKTFQEDINIDKGIFNEIYKECSQNSTDFMHCNLLSMPPTFYCKFEKLDVDLNNFL
jgi:hypothetical protein